MSNGILIASPHSGSGKTVVTLGLLRALSRISNVRAAKSGPDYIDPRFHEIASGNQSLNLDTWAMSESRIKNLSSGKGTFVVEGAMGLFDGDSSGRSGSAASLAKILDLQVILIIDCSKMAQSVAAIVKGFVSYDPDVKFLGVILNKIGSEKHLKMINESLSGKSFPPVIGHLKRSKHFHLPSRHLGLIQATEKKDLHVWLDKLADKIENSVNLDKLKSNTLIENKELKPLIKPPGKIISIAKDKAFSFIYPHLINDWIAQGSEINYFSPLSDEPVPESDFIFLPGGYPELYAEKLAENRQFLESVKEAAKNTNIYGECGGYMALGESLIDSDGKSHKMLDLLDLVTSIELPKLTLGYRKLRTLSGSIEGTFMGHEFHYARTLRANGKKLFTSSDASDNSLPDLGLVKGRVCGSFAHIIDYYE